MWFRLCTTAVVLAALGGGALDGRLDASSAAVQAEDTSALSILFVSNDDPDRPYVRQFADGLLEVLNAPERRATLYREFFDQVRFGDNPDYPETYRAWLHQKYGNLRIDAILVRQQETLRLFAQAPDNPWTRVPLVYGSLGALTVDISQTHPTVSGGSDRT